jgi:hypothetical protein
MVRRNILDVLERACDMFDRDNKNRNLAVLKAKLFDQGFTVFDVPKMPEREWTKLVQDKALVNQIKAAVTQAGGKLSLTPRAAVPPQAGADVAWGHTTPGAAGGLPAASGAGTSQAAPRAGTSQAAPGAGTSQAAPGAGLAAQSRASCCWTATRPPPSASMGPGAMGLLSVFAMVLWCALMVPVRRR